MLANTIKIKSLDNLILTGLIYKNEKRNNKILISVHGMATNCMKERDEEIAKKLNEINIDMLVFNNRGEGIANYIAKENGEKILGGTAFEDVEESYNDIVGAINYAISKEYKEIYIMGHSLGSTKTVYTYNKLIENKEEEILDRIKGIILLSLVDIPTAIRIYLNDKFPHMLTYAKNMEKENMENILMPEKSFIHPISVKTFLKYARDYKNIDFAKYSESEFEFPELNNIKVPLMMRWGTDREMILQKPEELCNKLKAKIKNPKLDIGYITGANHSYKGMEEELASEVRKFIEKSDNYIEK